MDWRCSSEIRGAAIRVQLGGERVRAWIGLAAIGWLVSTGCAATHNYLSPAHGYQPVGEPALTLEAAKAECLSESEFRSSNGLAWTNWNRFKACMDQRGWVQR